MPQDERAATADGPDPDPAVTAGLEPGGSVSPGDTSPDSDSMSGAVGDDRKNTPNMGPVNGGRGPMFITLTVLALITIAVIVLTVASFISS